MPKSEQSQPAAGNHPWPHVPLAWPPPASGVPSGRLFEDAALVLSQVVLSPCYLSSLPPPCRPISTMAAAAFPLSYSAASAVSTHQAPLTPTHPDHHLRQSLAPTSRVRCATCLPFSQQLTASPRPPSGICSLGEGFSYNLIRPVLESCTPDSLLRFEQADPVCTLPPPSPQPLW